MFSITNHVKVDNCHIRSMGAFGALGAWCWVMFNYACSLKVGDYSCLRIYTVTCCLMSSHKFCSYGKKCKPR